MKLSVKNSQGKAAGELEVKFELVEGGKGTQAVHDTVVAFRAAQRMGTACTKTAGEVAGTNKKPWRQKGTGRARAGSFQSPLWVGGGVVFGPRPRDFSKKVNARTKQLALRKALSERLKAGDVIVVDDLKLSSAKTKEFVGVINALDLKGTTLVVSTGVDKNLTLASRNIPEVALTTSDLLNTYDVLRPSKLLFTKSAFEKVEARVNKE
jgi:large subunit ribosomal protein L4